MITLRPAVLADMEVLKYWDTQAHVMESDPNDDWNWEKELTFEPNWRQQLMAEKEGLPIGFLQIIDPQLEETHYWGNIGSGYKAIDIWIGLSENIGKSYGTQMMTQALDLCFENPEIKEVIIDPLISNKKAIRFYTKLGFEPVEKKYFGDDFCLVMTMKRERWLTSKNLT